MLEELVGPLTVTVNQDLEDGTIGKLDYILRYKEIVTMVRTPHHKGTIYIMQILFIS